MRQVVLDTFPARSAKFEGRVPYFYLDVKRLVTIGVGNLVDPCPLGLDFGGASEAEIRDAWSAVKLDCTLDPRAGGVQYAALTAIRMMDAGIDALVRAKMLANEGVLRRYLTNWDAAPALAQMAAMSHAWAFGAFFPKSWPKWTARFTAGDYACAAAEDAPSPAEMQVQNASFHARIAAEQAWLACANDHDPDYLPEV